MKAFKNSFLVLYISKWSGSIDVIQAKVGYNCKKGHLTHAKDCKSSETEILILNYVNYQINSKNQKL